MSDDKKNNAPTQHEAQEIKTDNKQLHVKANWQSVVILALAALATTIVISTLQTLTKERIENQYQAAIEAGLNQVLPNIDYDNQLSKDKQALRAAGFFQTSEPLYYYQARRNEKVIAIVMEVVAPDGYNGDIRLLLGIDASGHLLGSRVTQHRETPGLGDAIEHDKSQWMQQFDQQSLSMTPSPQWQTQKQGGTFDAITGATITSSAVISVIERTLRYTEEHADILFDNEYPSHIN